jgi:hypothetical protein
MEFICQHCDGVATGRKYRVISEENGLIFLDMVVCHGCHEQAKQLGLHAERITADEKSLPHHARMNAPDALMLGR